MALVRPDKYPSPSTRSVLLSGLVLAILSVAILAISTTPFTLEMDDFSPALATSSLPLAFEVNRGQAGEGVTFQARSYGGYVQFMAQEVSWYLPEAGEERRVHSPSIGLQFQGASGAVQVRADKRLPGVTHYLIGDDPTLWRTNIPTFEEIVYEQLYPGIDLSYTGEQKLDGQWSLKGTYTVIPGANPNRIQWRYSGATGVRLDGSTGHLLISLAGTEDQTIIEEAPISWQEIDGKRVPVEVRYKLDEDGSIGFALGRYDPAKPLIIDPRLVFGTYLGTGTSDSARAIALDRGGSVIVAGWTDSVIFPITPDAFQPVSTGGTCYSPPPFNIPFPCNDGFITKFSADGSTLLYSTYFGGTRDDGITAMAVDSDDNITITGWTTSIDLPTMNPIQPANGSGNNLTTDSFVARLAADGSSLHYSTYLGGSARDYGDNLAVDSQGNAYVTGWTESTDFPTANPLQASYGGGFFDGVITKVNADGDAFEYSSYIGGDDLDYVFGVDVDGNGSAYLTGFTLSDDFPTANAMQPTFGGGIEAYVTKLTPSGSGLAYSTYFGSDDTRGYDIRVNDSGYAYLVGVTSSANFPLVNPLQAVYNGPSYDAFVSRFLPDGSDLDFSTYLGGTGHEVIHTLALDDVQNVHFVGWSSSADFPMNNPIQALPAGGVDIILGRITADLSALDFSTFLGGSLSEYGFAIDVLGTSQAHIAGYSFSSDFPTTPGVFDPEFNGGESDVIVAKIDIDLPDTPQAHFDSSSPDALGQTTVFTNTSSGGNLTYQWDFGDGSPLSVEIHPTHLYSETGSYSVTLTVSNTVGLSSITGTVDILLAPQADFISSSPDILGHTTVFTNTSIGSWLDYQWDFGDGSPVVSTTHPVHIYPAVGLYTVTLRAANLVGESETSAIVEIIEGPVQLFLPLVVDEP